MITVELALAFVVVFCAGPAIYALAMRRHAPRGWFALVAILIGGLAMAAFSLRAVTSPIWGLPPALVMLGFLWLAWVLVIVFCAQAFLQVAGDRQMARGVYIGGLLATTLPWFGLATARMVL